MESTASASVAYPLAAVLALAVTAIVADQLSELAIAQWGARQSADLLRALGFLDGRTPCQSTLQRLFCTLDGQATPARGYPAFCHERGVVLAQEPIERGEDKSEGELTVAPALVARDPRTGVAWPGRVLTGDRIPSGCFCERKLYAQVLAAGGDYLVLVKENQPTPLADLVLLFDPPAALGPAALLDRRAAATRDRGHGRQEEVRRLVASTDLTAYLD